MINYRVTKVSATTQEPVYSSSDEHGLDAFAFAMMAFMDEYANLIDIIEEVHIERDMNVIQPNRYNVMEKIDHQLTNGLSMDNKPKDPGEKEPQYQKVPLGYSRRKSNHGLNGLGWGNNHSSGNLWRNKRF